LGLLFGDVPYAIPETAFGFAIPLIGGAQGILATDGLAAIFVRIAVITVAMTIIIGVINLLTVHAHRIVRGQLLSKLNSFAIIVSFMAGIIAVIANRERPDASEFLLEQVQVPIESALAGLIFFALVFGAFRLLRDRVTPMGILFIITVEIVLIGALPLPGIAPLTVLTDWLMRVPVNAGARGILLGIALATLVTGLRVLIGQDRTYGE
jgi:hypothetical protein